MTDTIIIHEMEQRLWFRTIMSGDLEQVQKLIDRWIAIHSMETILQLINSKNRVNDLY